MTPNDVKIVVDNIHDFIEVPDGLERLRKAVLTLAVSGKLVQQNKKDGTAEDLCKKIKERHTQAVDSGTSRKKNGKDILPITPEETPFDIPKSWKWVKLNDIGTTNIGLTYSPNDISQIGTPVLRSSNVQNGQIDLRDLVRVKKDIKNSVMVNDGDLLICARNGSKALVGKTAMIRNLDEKMAFGAFMALYRSECNSYVEIFLKSPIFRNLLNGVSTTTINQITQDNLKNTLLPLPPMGEQRRILKKVEEVMKQFDELEARKHERDEVRTRLARSAMQSLVKGETSVAFDHLTELIKTSADIKGLEGALLTLAVSGKLVPQDKKEGSGTDLRNEIESKITKIKKRKEIEDKEKLFNIPSSWGWVRLEDVFDVRDGTHDSPKYVDTGYPLVTSKNLYYGKLDFLNVKYISVVDHKKISDRSKVDRDDILFAMIGSIGNPVIVDTDAEFSIKNVALFKYYDRKLAEPTFLLTYLKYAAENMRAVSAGGVQSFVSLGFLRQYPFPLPPLAEQKRIVKKVGEVLSLINHLKQVIEEK